MLDNSTKPRWIPDGRDIVDEHGTHIGTCADPSTAHYKARLHNNHVSRHPVLREVDLMVYLVIELSVYGTVSTGYDVAEASRPDGLPWTVEVDLNGTAETAAFAGASQIEALRFALDSLNDRAVSSEA